MSELIDRQALKNKICDCCEGNDEWCNGPCFEIMIIDSMPAIPAFPWHRVEDGLPDDTFKQVLITDGTHFGLAYCLDLGVYGVKWRKTNWMSIGGLFRGKITHWMPIEPPKEDA